MRNGEFVTGEPVPGTRYRVHRLLGVGGMGSVYEVEHMELGKRFVLKALLSDLAMREDLVTRLRNEQRALGRLEHPNIVTVTDAGVTSQNVPFFVMERLEGETLGARIKRVRRLPPLEALRVAEGVLQGLAAAHEIGVVHRDIKPPNIFLVAGNKPKLLDFGVAKIADAGGAITARGVAVGTPRYMSPEQASGEPVDGRSDLYAVGLLLFEMIVGHGPFDDARDANEMLLAQLGRRPPSLIECAPDVTPELDALVQSLLAKDPARRPQHARAAALSVCTAQRAYGAPERFDTATPPVGQVPAAGPSRATLLVGSPTGSVTDAPTVARGPAPREHTKDTLIDDRGSTLTGELGASTRTELLPAVTPPVASVTETRTQVLITPPDGERTLDPVPVEPRPPSVPPGERPRRGRALVAAGVLAVGGGLLLRSLLAAQGGAAAAQPPEDVLGGDAPSASSQPELTGASPRAGAESVTVGRAESPASSVGLGAPSGALTTRSASPPSAVAPASVPRVATGRPPSTASAVPAPVATPAAPKPAKSGPSIPTPRPAPAASGAAPTAARAPATPKSGLSVALTPAAAPSKPAPVPTGLPSSGL